MVGDEVRGVEHENALLKCQVLRVILTDCSELSRKGHFISTWQGLPKEGWCVNFAGSGEACYCSCPLHTLNAPVLPAGCKMVQTLPKLFPHDGAKRKKRTLGTSGPCCGGGGQVRILVRDPDLAARAQVAVVVHTSWPYPWPPGEKSGATRSLSGSLV